MKQAKKTVVLMLFFAGLILLLFLVLQPLQVLHFRDHIAILFPRGIIAREERNLLFIIQAIMLLVVLPVYVLTFIFSWKYNAYNSKAKYDPDLVDHKVAEYLWWGIPLVLTIGISILTWIKTHELDPYKPIVSHKKTVNIQVVALQWKWLFIYPDEKIASLNFLQIPEHTPIHFEITSDAPMNSFWIPRLGGQMYAMPKMRTHLNLIANEPGDFRGSSANISGEGFADMHFITRASSEEDYNKWVAAAKKSANILDLEKFNKLSAPSKANPATQYQVVGDLFDQIIMKYMRPAGNE